MDDISLSSLKTIGRITLNWGKAEGFVGMALEKIYNLDEDAAADLIHAIDLRKKIDLIEKKHKEGYFPKELDPIIDALKYANNNFRMNRNLAAHGIWGLHPKTGDRGLASFKSLVHVKDSDLNILLAQSRYVTYAAGHLIEWFHGIEERQRLPERPPQLPRSSIRP